LPGRYDDSVASPKRRLASNADGDFFVDDTCIDCATCRWMAPATFDYAGGASRVHRQPSDPAAVTSALRALVACPTGSIGTTERHPELPEVIRSFPIAIEPGVSHCGYHSADSFGAASYFLERPEGNVLVDSPRYNAHLARSLEERGGVRYLFLTHRDDVADHEKWAERFGAERILHRDDRTRDTSGVERWLAGMEPEVLLPGVTMIPTPGHTRGSACLLVDDAILFTGDTLAWSPRLGHVYAFRDACWYSWPELEKSIARLATYTFRRVLPGHGRPVATDAQSMAESMRACLAWM
jgi:glyoxylase-like metal-dependent hydrolase (beta-lactamase superfamily II)/ferredoxin